MTQPRGCARSVAQIPADQAEPVPGLLFDSTVLIGAWRGRPTADRVWFARRSGGEPWTCPMSAEGEGRGAGPATLVAADRPFVTPAVTSHLPAASVRSIHWPVGS